MTEQGDARNDRGWLLRDDRERSVCHLDQLGALGLRTLSKKEYVKIDSILSLIKS